MKSKRIKIFWMLFAVLASIGLLVGSMALLTDFYMRNSVEDHVYTIDNFESDEMYDCIFVLGCGIRSDGSPSHMLQDRLETAYALYAAGVSDYILVSGDNGRVD